MMAKSNLPAVLVSDEIILQKILLMRGQKVMLDRDLAEMYGVKVRVLNQAVKRNVTRFPEDFMFQLAQNEWRDLKSHFAASGWGGARKPPYRLYRTGGCHALQCSEF